MAFAEALGGHVYANTIASILMKQFGGSSNFVRPCVYLYVFTTCPRDADDLATRAAFWDGIEAEVRATPKGRRLVMLLDGNARCGTPPSAAIGTSCPEAEKDVIPSLFLKTPPQRLRVRGRGQARGAGGRRPAAVATSSVHARKVNNAALVYQIGVVDVLETTCLKLTVY